MSLPFFNVLSLPYALSASHEKNVKSMCLISSLSQMLIYLCLCNVTGCIPIQKIAHTPIQYKHYQMLLSIISFMGKT